MESDDRVQVIGASPQPDALEPRARPSTRLGVVAIGVAAALIAASMALTTPRPESVNQDTPQLAAPDAPVIRGIESLSTPPDLPTIEGPGWYPVLAVPLSTGTTPHLIGVVSAGPHAHIVTTSGVFELVMDGGTVDLEPSIFVPSLAGSAVSVSAVDFGSSPVQVYPGIGGWTGRSRPLEGLIAIGTAADGTGPYAVVVSETGTWEVTTDLPRDLYVTWMVDGIQVGQRLIDGVPAGAAVFNRSGDEWRRLAGWQVDPAIGFGPVLTSIDEAGVLTFPGSALPETTTVQVPTERSLSGVFVLSDGLIATDAEAVHFRADTGWTSHPIDGDHGVVLPALPVSADPPRIATVVDGLLVISTWAG